jgi:hypothetical protein
MRRRLSLVMQGDERGASLVLAICFMVIIGAIAGATLSMVTSGLNNRRSLDSVRNREYAADAATEYAIAQVRAGAAPGPVLPGCAANIHYNYSLNGSNIRINCLNTSTFTLSQYYQLNAVFTACPETGADCSDATAIVRAQVNYQATIRPTIVTVTRTWVQSWSVNG